MCFFGGTLYRLFEGLTSAAVSSVKKGLQGGRFAPESVAGIDRNQWPLSIGIGGRLRPEYAPHFDLSSQERKNPRLPPKAL